MTQPQIPIAMTVAGSDSSGGAGIQADLKTFTVLGVYGATAITAITAQNTRGVSEILMMPPGIVRSQIDSITDDIGCHAAKTGMLGSVEIVGAVAERLAESRVPNLVVDPVMVAKSGHRLLEDDAVRALIEQLFPLAAIVTPNVPEAEALLGRSIGSVDEMTLAARELCGMGPAAVIVKGGHIEGDAVDVMYVGATEQTHLQVSRRIETPHTHGTGCSFSAALAAFLARGCDLEAAFAQAKRFITCGIRHALAIGGGRGPIGHIQAGREMAGEL